MQRKCARIHSTEGLDAYIKDMSVKAIRGQRGSLIVGDEESSHFPGEGSFVEMGWAWKMVASWGVWYGWGECLRECPAAPRSGTCSSWQQFGVMMGEKVWEVRRGEIIEDFESEKRNFKVDPRLTGHKWGLQSFGSHEGQGGEGQRKAMLLRWTEAVFENFEDMKVFLALGTKEFWIGIRTFSPGLQG